MNKRKLENDHDEQLNDITEELIQMYGPTMSLSEVAGVLKRNKNALRTLVSKAEKELAESNDGFNKPFEPWVIKLVHSKCPSFSHKLLFRTNKIAEIV